MNVGLKLKCFGCAQQVMSQGRSPSPYVRSNSSVSRFAWLIMTGLRKLCGAGVRPVHNQIRILLYSLFIGALFFEWMVPLRFSTDTGRIDIFLLAFMFFLIMDILRLPVWL